MIATEVYIYIYIYKFISIYVYICILKFICIYALYIYIYKYTDFHAPVGKPQVRRTWNGSGLRVGSGWRLSLRVQGPKY